jgi:hypothetical protein
MPIVKPCGVEDKRIIRTRQTEFTRRLLFRAAPEISQSPADPRGNHDEIEESRQILARLWPGELVCRNPRQLERNERAIRAVLRDQYNRLYLTIMALPGLRRIAALHVVPSKTAGLDVSGPRD